MATKLQRGKAIADAIINGTATNAQLNRLGRAMAFRTMRVAEYDAANAAGKADILIDGLRIICLQLIQERESIDAIETARIASNTAVASAFTEVPE